MDLINFYRWWFKQLSNVYLVAFRNYNKNVTAKKEVAVESIEKLKGKLKC